MTTSYILGAGVDRALGLPLANELLSELGTFENSEGKVISKTIKDKLGGGRRVRFNFEKYRANQGEGFAERVLTEPKLATVLQGALTKLGNDSSRSATAVQSILTRLQTGKDAIELDEDTATAVAQLSGDSENMADYTMLRTRGIALSPAPRNAMVRIFRDARTAEGLSPEEMEGLDTIVAAMTNFEELLAEKFAGFYAANHTEIRNYLYIAWLLWAYIRWKSLSAQAQIGDVPNFYNRLTEMAPDDSVITFNYTALADLPAERTVRFHGECLSYIRFDRGELLTDDEAVVDANDLDALVEFIEQLDMDYRQGEDLHSGDCSTERDEAGHQPSVHHPLGSGGCLDVCGRIADRCGLCVQ